MAELVDADKQIAFGQHILTSLPKYYCGLATCGSPATANVRATGSSPPDGEPGLNYLCAGNKAFFSHIDSGMKIVAGLLQQGRFADEIVQMYTTQHSTSGKENQ